MFALLISRTSSETGHVGSKTRSLGQIIEKRVSFRFPILVQILMKLGHE